MRHRSVMRRRFFGIAALIWLGVLVFFSSQTATDSGALSGSLVERLLSPLLALGIPFNTLDHLLRKFAHGSAFAMEGFLCYLSVSTVLRPRRAYLATAIICGLIAIGNELQQLFSAGRSCEVRDMLIDLSGALIGALIARVLVNRSHYKTRNDR